MKKLVVLSLSLLSLTVNAGKFTDLFKRKAGKTDSTESMEMRDMTLGKSTSSIQAMEPNEKQSRLQRFKKAITPGGEKTKAVGRAIAKPFKAIGRSTANSYRDLKEKYAPRTETIINKGGKEELTLSEVSNTYDVTSKKDKAKIIALKGLAGAAAPFHAAGRAIGNAWSARKAARAKQQTAQSLDEIVANGQANTAAKNQDPYNSSQFNSERYSLRGDSEL